MLFLICGSSPKLRDSHSSQITKQKSPNTFEILLFWATNGPICLVKQIVAIPNPCKYCDFEVSSFRRPLQNECFQCWLASVHLKYCRLKPLGLVRQGLRALTCVLGEPLAFRMGDFLYQFECHWELFGCQTGAWNSSNREQGLQSTRVQNSDISRHATPISQHNYSDAALPTKEDFAQPNWPSSAERQYKR